MTAGKMIKMTMARIVATAGIALMAVSASAYTPKSFKEKAKRGSWDAWESQQMTVSTERPCVTWKKLNKLDPGLECVGRLRNRTPKEIEASEWSVGCETLDRDYADFSIYKPFLAELGAKRARFFSGWAKTEQEKGKYDFTWLDPHLRETAAMGVKPWVCLSYANPVYGGDFRLGTKIRHILGNPEATAAWLAYVKACVARYRDVVDEWEVWNEAYGQGADYAELFYITAKAVREVQPEAKIFVTAISFPKEFAMVHDRLVKEHAEDFASYWIYHPYKEVPEHGYEEAHALRALVKGWSAKYEIFQGESGCPSQLEFQHALHSIEWTEYAQAKWDLRLSIGDAARRIRSNVFTIIDLQYPFMLQSFGLIRSNTLNEFIYRRPSYYAMRNVYSLFDSKTEPVRTWINADGETGRTVHLCEFSRAGAPLAAYWYGDRRPSAELDFARLELLDVLGEFEDPVLVEMITGRIFAPDPKDVTVHKGKNYTSFRNLPVWDAPVVLMPRAFQEGLNNSRKGE